MTGVSIRERVKLPPSAAMLDSYMDPALRRAFEYHFENELWVHLAHAQMLVRQTILTEADAKAIMAALVKLHGLGPNVLAPDGSLEDLYSYTERWLIGQLGPEIGGRLHTGRSRNDLDVTKWRMTLRTAMLATLERLLAMRAAVLQGAAQYAGTIMPGYTHWQHAQPVTFGYYLLGFADALSRDHARCLAALRRTNCSPLGAAALTTTSFPLDRHWTAAALGFEGLVEVAYDAVSSRDDAHETAAAMAVLMTGLSRLATDLQAWSTMEYGMVELGDQHSSVSSIMPQKKNPAALEHIKAEAAQVTGFLVAALASSKNTAYADVSDGVTGTSDPSLDAVIRTGRVLRLFAEVVGVLTVAPDRMKHLATIGFGTATELADVIVSATGLSFRMAHNIVATVVSEAIERHQTAETITSADLDRAAQSLFGRPLGLDPATIREALDPEGNVRRRTVAGGPAPDTMAAMLEARTAELARDVAEVARVSHLVKDARSRVFATARQAG
jgi:argininosuccinate lyase